MILNRQGRLLGLLNPLDLLVLFFLLTLGSTVWYAVRASHHKTLEIFSAEPKRIVAGPGKRVVMKGTGFDRESTIRLGDYNDQGGVYFDESTIWLEITEQYEPGVYRAIVHDGRGRYAALPDAVEVIWQPKISGVNPKIIYSQGAGASLEVLGEFFTSHCTLRVGDRELEVVDATAHKRIQGKLKKGEAPLPLGEQDVTVTNLGGQSVTWERAVTVLPAPEVHSIEPDTLRLGETVDLFLHGHNLREGTLVWLGEHLMGEARHVSPECLRIEVTGTPTISMESLILQLPNGPKTEMMERAMKIRSSSPVLVVVDILLDEKGRAALESLRQRPEWRVKRLLRNLDLPLARRNFNSSPVVEVVVPALLQGGHGVYRYEYGGQQLRVGEFIRVLVDGRKVSGTVAARPFALLADDTLKAKEP